MGQKEDEEELGLKERRCRERHQAELQEDEVVELGMEQVQEQECGGSVLPQDCSNSRREKALPEAGLSSGVLRMLENKAVIRQGRGKLVKIERHPQMGEAALTVPLHSARPGLRLCQ